MRAALLLALLALAGIGFLTLLPRGAGGTREVGPLPGPERVPVLEAPPAVRALREILHPVASLASEGVSSRSAPTLHGRVVDALGRSTVAEVVLVEAVEHQPERYKHGFRGSSFEFRPAEAGRYWVLARGPEGVSRTWLELDPRRPEPQGLVLQLEGSGRLRGKLTDAAGRPLVDWPLAFRRAGSPWETDPILDLEVEVPAFDDDYDGPGRTWAFARTEAFGAFHVRGLRPGVWSIRTSRVGFGWRGEHVLAHAVAADGRSLPLVLPVHRLHVELLDERHEALPFQPAAMGSQSGLRLWRIDPGGWRRVFHGWRPTGLPNVWETFLEPDALHAVTFGSSARPIVHSEPIAAAERGTSEVEVRAAPKSRSGRVRVRLPEDLDDDERSFVVVHLEEARHGVPIAAQLFSTGARGGELELDPIPPGVYDLSVGGLTRLRPELRAQFDAAEVAPSLWSTRLVVPPGGVSSFLALVEPRGELRVPAEVGTVRLEREGDVRTPTARADHWIFEDLRPGPWRLHVRAADGSEREERVEVLRSRVTTLSGAR